MKFCSTAVSRVKQPSVPFNRKKVPNFTLGAMNSLDFERTVLPTMGMSSLVAVLSKAAPADISLVEKMLAAAPHRGTDLCAKTFGSCAIGVSNDSETIDGTISKGARLLAAFVGNTRLIDNSRI